MAAGWRELPLQEIESRSAERKIEMLTGEGGRRQGGRTHRGAIILNIR